MCSSDLVNQPHATEANTPYRDGLMRVDGNFGARVNYSPSHQDSPQIDKQAMVPPYHVEGMLDRIELNEEDHFDQAKMFYDMLSEDEKGRLVENIAGSLGKCAAVIQSAQMGLFNSVSPELASRVKTAIATIQPPQPHPAPGSV